MKDIRILHVSDLHYSKVNNKDYDQNIVLTALFQDIAELRKTENIKIDLIIFSGDLVQAGDRKDDFDNAFEDFIKPLVSAAGISIDKFFLVPGNHDISRKAVSSPVWVEKGLLSELSNVDALNTFIDEYWDSSKHSAEPFQRIQNYEAFIKKLDTPSQLDTPFVKTHLIKCQDATIRM